MLGTYINQYVQCCQPAAQMGDSIAIAGWIPSRIRDVVYGIYKAKGNHEKLDESTCRLYRQQSW